MRKITFRADERLIEAARARARAKRTTLNQEFRRWLADYVQHERQTESALQVLNDLRGRLRVGRRLTRDEMNES